MENGNTVKRDTFAARLESMCATLSFEPSDIADLMDVNTESVNAWYWGENLPPLPKLRALARLFNTTPEYLLGLTDDMAPNSRHIVVFNIVKRKRRKKHREQTLEMAFA